MRACLQAPSANHSVISKDPSQSRSQAPARNRKATPRHKQKARQAASSRIEKRTKEADSGTNHTWRAILDVEPRWVRSLKLAANKLTTMLHAPNGTDLSFKLLAKLSNLPSYPETSDLHVLQECRLLCEPCSQPVCLVGTRDEPAVDEPHA